MTESIAIDLPTLTYNPETRTITDENGEIQLPRNFVDRDDCPSCKQWNRVEEVEVTEEGVICRFHCTCGFDHGIIQKGQRTIQRYNDFIEDFVTKPAVNTPEEIRVS